MPKREATCVRSQRQPRLPLTLFSIEKRNGQRTLTGHNISTSDSPAITALHRGITGELLGLRIELRLTIPHYETSS